MCVIPTSLGAPQIFPFSNLRSYFDHQARNGPGGGKHGVVPDITAVVDTPLFRQPSKIGDFPVKSVSSPPPTIYATAQQPTNHNPDISPNLESPSARVAASPVLKYNLPVPEQVLKAPDAVTPLLYGPITEQVKTIGNYQIPKVTQGIVSQIPISVVGEKKYKPIGGFVPLAPPYVLVNPPTVTRQKAAGSYSTTVPSQDVQIPAVSLKYSEEYVNQKTQDNIKVPQPVIPAKTTKAPSHLYPKKWRPEKEKDNIKKKSPKTDSGVLGTINADVTSTPQKKERKHIREQTLPAPIVAANSFQKADVGLFPVQAKRKVPGIDEQVERKKFYLYHLLRLLSKCTVGHLWLSAPVVACLDSKSLQQIALQHVVSKLNALYKI
jgi:hypothetical protein